MQTGDIIKAENKRNAWPCLLLVYDCYGRATLGYTVYCEVPPPLGPYFDGFYRSY